MLKQICHPDLERTRISCYAALTSSRMKFANATSLDRKSSGSGVEGPAVLF